MSLTKDQLIQFIEKPSLLKEQTIGELKEIVDEFPYFQTAQLLYTCNLHTLDNFRFESYLKICSVYATDRSVLYRLLQPKAETDHFPKQSLLSTENNHQELVPLFELSEEKQITETEFPEFTTTESKEEEIIDFDLLSFDQSDTPFLSDDAFDFAIEGNTDPAQIETIESKSEQKVDLIEQFIKINPTIQPRIDISHSQNELFELRQEEDVENDEFITETLSRIYLKQGHYQKAIDSFKRLSLKFPEKSVYFAQQIEEIKKLLN